MVLYIRNVVHVHVELFNLPPPVLKARYLSDSAFCWVDIGLPEQAVGGFPLGLGLVVEDGPTELSCTWNVKNPIHDIVHKMFSMHASIYWQVYRK